MQEYHKIQSVFKRNPQFNNKRFTMWDWTMPEFEYLKDNLWSGSEKIDGTNCRLSKDGQIGGRTDNAQLHTGLIQHLKEVSDRLQSSPLPDNIVLYGEGYGAKIQSGGQYLPDRQGFVLFDVMIAGNYQPRSSVEDIASKLDIPIVPILSTKSLTNWVDAISNGAFMESALHPGAKNEGVVLRPLTELQTRTGNRVITKLKFKDFGF